MDYDTELKSTDNEKTNVHPDHNIVTVGAERFRFAKELFVAHSAQLRRLHPASRHPSLAWP